VDDTQYLNWDYAKQRYWRIQAVNAGTGEDVGGLKIFSHKFGPPILPGRSNPNIPLNETYFGNHWWLKQDVHVLNATGRRDSVVLITDATTPDYNKRRALAHPFLSRGGPYDDAKPVVFFTLKLEHNVIEEELPVQGGFADIEVVIMPENMYGFNPDILVRYDPVHNDVMENRWMESYVAPYRYEFEDVPVPSGDANEDENEEVISI